VHCDGFYKSGAGVLELTVRLFPIQRRADIGVVAGEDKVPERVLLGVAEVSGMVEDSHEDSIDNEIDVVRRTELQLLFHMSCRVAHVKFKVKIRGKHGEGFLE